MRYDLSLVPTEDLKALRNRDYGALSTPTLKYLKTGDPKNVQGAAVNNDIMPHSIPQAWSMAWGARIPSGPRQLGYRFPVPGVSANQGEAKASVPKRIWKGAKNDAKDMARGVLNPVRTAGGVLVYAMAPFAALNKDEQIKIDPYSTWSPRFSKGPGHAPEIPREILDRQRNLKRALNAAWDSEKNFVSTNVKDPKGIPGRALNYAIDHPVNTALLAAGGLGVAGKVAAAGKLSTAAKVLTKAHELTSPATPAKWAWNKAKHPLGDWVPSSLQGKATKAPYPLRLPTAWYQKTIQSFINQIGRLRHTKLSREEIFSRYGNDLVPVGEIDSSTMARLNVRDPKVYTGEAYFVDHHLNHHPENLPARYRTIPDILAHWDDIKIDSRPGREGGYIFIKRYDRYHTLVTRVGEEEGRLLLYKTFVTSTRQPYKTLPSIKDRPVGEVGHTSIGSTPQRGVPPEAVTTISGLPTGLEYSVPKTGKDVKLKPSVNKNN
jgi:hypothetical protein